MIPRQDLLWLAGLLEGEGSFMPGPPSKPNSPRVQVQMADRDVIERAAATLGTTQLCTYQAHEDWKAIYSTCVRGKRAIAIMQQLYPLMGMRRRAQIERAIMSYHPMWHEPKSHVGLTHEQILEIYKRAATGDPCKSIAADFDVTYKTVWDIKHGKAWAWLTGHKETSEQ